MIRFYLAMLGILMAAPGRAQVVVPSVLTDKGAIGILNVDILKPFNAAHDSRELRRTVFHEGGKVRRRGELHHVGECQFFTTRIRRENEIFFSLIRDVPEEAQFRLPTRLHSVQGYFDPVALTGMLFLRIAQGASPLRDYDAILECKGITARTNQELAAQLNKFLSPFLKFTLAGAAVAK